MAVTDDGIVNMSSIIEGPDRGGLTRRPGAARPVRPDGRVRGEFSAARAYRRHAPSDHDPHARRRRPRPAAAAVRVGGELRGHRLLRGGERLVEPVEARARRRRLHRHARAGSTPRAAWPATACTSATCSGAAWRRPAPSPASASTPRPGRPSRASSFDGRLLRNPGWHAGVQDAATDRWLWCGDSCSTSANHWVHDERRGLATTRLASIVRCVSTHCRRDRLQAFVALRNVRVTLSDPSPPALGRAGRRRRRMVARPDRARPSARAMRPASAPSGSRSTARRALRRARLRLHPAGAVHGRRAPRRARHARARRRRSPAARRGRRRGRELVVGRAADPRRQHATARAGRWRWRAAPAGTRSPGASMRVTLPPGQAAPVARAVLAVCRAGGGPCRRETAAVGAGGRVALPPLPGPGRVRRPRGARGRGGQRRAGVAAGDAPLRRHAVPARPTCAPPTAGCAAMRRCGSLQRAPRPRRGSPGSGVGDRVVASALPLDGFAEGATPIEVRSVSGAGVTSTAVRTQVRIDRGVPSVAASGVPAGDAWTAAPVTVTLSARDDRSGVARIAWRAGDAAERVVPGAEATVSLADDGRHAVAYRAIDEAGNASPPGILLRPDRPDAARDGRVRGAGPGRSGTRARHRRRTRRRAWSRAGSSCAPRAARGARSTPSWPRAGSPRGSTTPHSTPDRTSCARVPSTRPATPRSAPPARTARPPRSRSRSAGRSCSPSRGRGGSSPPGCSTARRRWPTSRSCSSSACAGGRHGDGSAAGGRS